MNLLHYVIAIAVFLTHFSNSEEIDSKHNVFCKPMPTVVAVEQDGLPYYVTLNRCQGSVPGHNPYKKKCVEVENTSTIVRVKVTVHSGETEVIEMTNDTQCTGQCIFDDQKCDTSYFTRNDDNCSCTCKFPNEAPTEIEYDPKTQRWNPQSCSLDCTLKKEDAPRVKRIDSEKCQFVCKRERCHHDSFYVHEETCHCKKRTTNTGASTGEKGNTRGVVFTAVIVAVVEFFVLYLIFDLFLYHKKTGLVYNIKRTCSKPKHPPTQNGVHSSASDGCNVPLTVRVDQNGTTTLQNKQNVSAI